MRIYMYSARNSYMNELVFFISHRTLYKKSYYYTIKINNFLLFRLNFNLIRVGGRYVNGKQLKVKNIEKLCVQAIDVSRVFTILYFY